MKTDQNIKDIVVAAICRHSMDMNTWTHTQLWDEGDAILKTKLSHVCKVEAGELPILYSYIDPANWTLFTTRRIWYATEEQLGSVVVSEIVTYGFGNFKGYSEQKVERMEIHSRNTEIHYCPFETGKASMGSIYAVRTLSQLGSAL
ncbi:hypothetical protein K9N68_14665 [Kovacikia minuta CCNUW1]|uniref:hypothetical protein n=1 Tax=Kovacikia minuta TaxID=2931930 RepID=UPI001CCD83CE|nr:hypothetical protein [Kovacikia minuta]UBF28966.1 hypothetical protein K9N68_14665 [Kovacikia minuta CCNUW1]